MKWAEEVLKPTAELAYNGEGEYNAGDHCQFCKAKATCRKRAEHNLELAQYDFDMPPNLDDAEIAAILPRIDDLVASVQNTPASKSWKANRTASSQMRMQLQPS